MIVGVTGFMTAGKDTFANYLVEKKRFIHISLSDILRQDLKKTKKKITRQALMELGNLLRQNLGGGILAQRSLQKIQPDENIVISSIGTVAEVKELQKRKDFILVFIDAPQTTRFQRITVRKREEDPSTLEEFKQKEKTESKGGGKAYREFDNVRKLAKVIIKNNTTPEAFHKKIDTFITDWQPKLRHKRPSWDQYFLDIVTSVAQRATCDRGKTASVIVKDKRILTTGYVGSPQGLPHCDEVGHLYKKVKHEDGHISQHCVRTLHGEQNAILQAAKYGIPIQGSTIYCKLAPCPVCAMMIINAGIKRVVSKIGYHGAIDTPKIFKKAGVKFQILNKKIEEYANQ
ncbi:hypothetical protein CMO92_01505 [Candidatus Woesearchaeota archaeon]|nr:hypothetical protein [Candidatus Woesearchaeota archaeon]